MIGTVDGSKSKFMGGKCPVGAEEFFTGLIDDVRMYVSKSTLALFAAFYVRRWCTFHMPRRSLSALCGYVCGSQRPSLFARRVPAGSQLQGFSLLGMPARANLRAFGMA